MSGVEKAPKSILKKRDPREQVVGGKKKGPGEESSRKEQAPPKKVFTFEEKQKARKEKYEELKKLLEPATVTFALEAELDEWIDILRTGLTFAQRYKPTPEEANDYGALMARAKKVSTHLDSMGEADEWAKCLKIDEIAAEGRDEEDNPRQDSTPEEDEEEQRRRREIASGKRPATEETEQGHKKKKKKTVAPRKESYIPEKKAPTHPYPLHPENIDDISFLQWRELLRKTLIRSVLPQFSKAKQKEIINPSASPDFLCTMFQKKAEKLKEFTPLLYPVLEKGSPELISANMSVPLVQQGWGSLWSSTIPAYSLSLCRWLIGNMWFTIEDSKFKQPNVLGFYWGPNGHHEIGVEEMNEIFGTPNEGEEIFEYGRGCPEKKETVENELSVTKDRDSKDYKMNNDIDRILILMVTHCIYGKLGRSPSNLELIVAYRLKKNVKMNFGSLFIAMMLQHYKHSTHICLAPWLIKIFYHKTRCPFVPRDLKENIKSFGRDNEGRVFQQREIEINKMENTRLEKLKKSVDRKVSSLKKLGMTISGDDNLSLIPGQGSQSVGFTGASTEAAGGAPKPSLKIIIENQNMHTEMIRELIDCQTRMEIRSLAFENEVSQRMRRMEDHMGLAPWISIPPPKVGQTKMPTGQEQGEEEEDVPEGEGHGESRP